MTSAKTLRNREWEPVIGLEVHLQLATRSKLFCGCSTAYGAEPNTQVCPICLGYPGALPAPNRGAIELAVCAGIALKSQVQERSRFARKSYFYPDLPKGYQISQLDLPINLGGRVAFEGGELLLERAHLEEDAAKSTHERGETRVDFNRGGVPLLEIVSTPALRTSQDAEQYLRALRALMMAAGVSDGNLEEGSFRCDANISLRPLGTEEFGTRVEIKNINSFRFVRRALDAEIARQRSVLGSGGEVERETRGWDESSGTTRSLRGKELAADYRYFPDPDLPEVRVDAERIRAIRDAMPELPDALRTRWLGLGLTDYDVGVLGAHPALAAYVDAVVGDCTLPPKKVANFIQSEVLGSVQTNGLEATFPLKAKALADLLDELAQGAIHQRAAKRALECMIAEGLDAASVIAREGLSQTDDHTAIERWVDDVLQRSEVQVAQYLGGKTAVIGYFVGQVMAAARSASQSPNPQTVKETVQRLLEQRR